MWLVAALLLSLLLEFDHPIPSRRFHFLAGTKLHELLHEGSHLDIVVDFQCLRAQHHPGVVSHLVDLQIQQSTVSRWFDYVDLGGSLFLAAEHSIDLLGLAFILDVLQFDATHLKSNSHPLIVLGALQTKLNSVVLEVSQLFDLTVHNRNISADDNQIQPKPLHVCTAFLVLGEE